jgi:predicted NUDIX family phosphoesterase
MKKSKQIARNIKDYELVFVTTNEPTIHYALEDYIHIESLNEAWTEEALSKSCFVERWMAEKDSTILQFIPYIVCYDDEHIFTYSRKSGGEERLEGRKSLGIGGHVNIHDKHIKVSNIENELAKINTANTWDVVINGAIREACEELDISKKYVEANLVQVGTMYTPTDGTGEKNGDIAKPKVSEVHIAVIYKLKVPKDTTIKENEGMINPEFVHIKDLKKDNFEFWSQMVIDKIEDIHDI